MSNPVRRFKLVSKNELYSGRHQQSFFQVEMHSTLGKEYESLKFLVSPEDFAKYTLGDEYEISTEMV